MAVSLFNVIRTRYRLHKITAVEVWAYVDSGELTEAQAIQICGPRPATKKVNVYPDDDLYV